MQTTASEFRLGHHVILSVAMALVAPATGFASPIAILTGLVIANDEADTRAGVRVRAATSISFGAAL
jgi:hypothetical protein